MYMGYCIFYCSALMEPELHKKGIHTTVRAIRRNVMHLLEINSPREKKKIPIDNLTSI